jgi:hypothetical protein
LTVGDDERAEGSQTLQSLVSMLLRGVLINRCTWKRSIVGLDLLCLPNEVLEQVALVLGEEEIFGLLDDVANIGNEAFALSGESCVGLAEGLGGKEAVERDIDLLVLCGTVLAMVLRMVEVSKQTHSDSDCEGARTNWTCKSAVNGAASGV